MNIIIYITYYINNIEGDFIKWYYYLLLGFIQGLTEPLPISSSGHLIIFENLLKINTNNLLIEIITNFGSLVAIIIFYFKDINDLFIGIKKKKKDKISYIKKIIIASIPALIFGLVLYKFISLNKSLFIIGSGLLLTGLFLLLLNNKIKSNTNNKITYKNSIYIGLSQVLALIPGISRSGTTTMMGVYQKINFKEALKFSFMLYIPISFGTIILSLKDISVIKDNLFNYFLGFFVSFITTLISLKLFIKLVQNKKIKYFSYYCFIIGLLALLLNFL